MHACHADLSIVYYLPFFHAFALEMGNSAMEKRPHNSDKFLSNTRTAHSPLFLRFESEFHVKTPMDRCNEVIHLYTALNNAIIFCMKLKRSVRYAIRTWNKKHDEHIKSVTVLYSLLLIRNTLIQE